MGFLKYIPGRNPQFHTNSTTGLNCPVIISLQLFPSGMCSTMFTMLDFHVEVYMDIMKNWAEVGGTVQNLT